MTLKSIKKLSPGIDENAGSFSGLSQVVGSEVDINTGEIRDIITHFYPTGMQLSPQSPGFSNDQNIIRSTVGEWGEKQVKKLIPYARSMEPGSLYDIQKGNLKLEVKTTNLGNASVIKSIQVEKLNEIDGCVYYSFIFYKIKGGIKPSLLPNDAKLIRRKLEVDSIFLFPIKYVVYLANTLPRVNTIHAPFRKVHRNGILELFRLAKEKGETVRQDENIYIVGDIVEFLKK